MEFKVPAEQWGHWPIYSGMGHCAHPDSRSGHGLFFWETMVLFLGMRVRGPGRDLGRSLSPTFQQITFLLEDRTLVGACRPCLCRGNDPNDLIQLFHRIGYRDGYKDAERTECLQLFDRGFLCWGNRHGILPYIRK